MTTTTNDFNYELTDEEKHDLAQLLDLVGRAKDLATKLASSCSVEELQDTAEEWERDLDDVFDGIDGMHASLTMGDE